MSGSPRHTPSDAEADRKEGSARSAKRRLVRTACLPCRKRKSKCDARLPGCMTCQLHKTECVYDFDADRRRNPSRRYIESLEARVTALEAIVNAIRNANSDSLPDIVREIRSGRDDIEYYAPLSMLPSRAKPDDSHEDAPSAPLQELGKIMGSLQLEEGQVRYFGPTSNLSLVSTDSPSTDYPPDYPHPADSQLRQFFYNPELIDHLLNLYWAWQHQYFVVLDKDLFLRDLATGGKFASGSSPLTITLIGEFLLNAILCHAAPYSTRPDLRSDQNDPSTAGYYYYKRARQILWLDEDLMARPSVVTCQGLALLASHEAGCSRNARGWTISGMCFRMAIDLGLHLDSRRLVESGHLSEEEYNVRCITFWGCFIFDRGWSVYLGRPTIIPCEAINSQRPSIDVRKEAEPWTPYYNVDDPGVRERVFPERPSHICTIFERICMITEILGGVIGNLYSAISKFENSSGTYRADVIADWYYRLNSWYKELPTHLRCDPSSTDGVLPPVIMMQYIVFLTFVDQSMLYHTTTILLFRPFGAHKEVAGITPSPWELCTSSASSIVTLLKFYRSRFSLRYIVNLSVHMLFTASIVHLVNTMSSKQSLQRSSKIALRTCMLGFSEIGEAWASATKSLRVVESLQRKWQQDPPSPEKEAIAISTKKDTLAQDNPEVNIAMSSAWQPNFTEATEEYLQYFLPETQNMLASVDGQSGFSNSAFWDHVPFLESGYDSYPIQDPF